MKYCRQCRVFAHKDLTRCPLCGSYLVGAEKAESPPARYERESEPCVRFVPLDYQGDFFRHFLRKKSLLLTIAAILIAVLVNRLITPRQQWWGYVVIGGLAVYWCVLQTIYRRRRFYSLLAVCAYALSAALYLIDLTISFDLAGNASYFGISLQYAVPGLLFALLITCDVMSFVEKSGYKYYLVSLVLVSVVALVPEIVVLCLTVYRNWLTFPLFCFTLLNLFVVAVLYWKPLKSEMARKFHT